MASSSETLRARGFAADAETERALRSGLSGHEAKVQRGRFDTAIRTLAAERSSELVFVDLDGVPEPAAAARELTAVCAFGTALIAIGSADTAHLTRVLLREGIADYLVKPVSPSAVREASATALDRAPERTYAGRVIAFAGSAGSGVSTLVAAIARGVAAGNRTATVVDLNPASASLPIQLRAKPGGDLAAVLDTLGGSQPNSDPGLDSDELIDPDETPDPDPLVSPELLDGICSPAGIPSISLVAYPSIRPLPETPSAPTVCTLLGHLANRAHVVLVAGLHDPEARAVIMQQADARVLVYEPTLPSISAAVHCLALVGAESPTVLVQCHPRTRRSMLSQAQIGYALADRRPDVIIPFEPTLHAIATGVRQRRPLDKAYVNALREVIQRAVDVPAHA